MAVISLCYRNQKNGRATSPDSFLLRELLLSPVGMFNFSFQNAIGPPVLLGSRGFHSGYFPCDFDVMIDENQRNLPISGYPGLNRHRS